MSDSPAQPLAADQRLIDRAADGDHHAFELLYRKYRDSVASLAFRFTQNHDLALDVLQETFIYLARKIADGDLQLTAKMTTFLYPVVKNISIRAAQKSRRFSASASLPATPAPPAPDPLQSADLQTLIHRLPEAHREVILMRFVDDMPLAEIADALNVPLGTVKSRLHHALKTLRDAPAVKKYFHPD